MILIIQNHRVDNSKPLSRSLNAQSDAPTRTSLAWRRTGTDESLPEVYRSIAVPHQARVWRKMAAFAGPGFLVAVGYMDPGNWATDLAGGAKFGYTLLW